MSIAFNADEVFEIAEQKERDGAEFYRKAGRMLHDPKVKKLLGDLADWEDAHARAFAQMREGLSRREREPVFFDPNDEAVLYLKAIADDHVARTRHDVSDFLKGDESAEQVLRKALRFERDAIAFYVGMRDLVTVELGKDKIDKIIKEEKSHVVHLIKQLASD